MKRSVGVKHNQVKSQKTAVKSTATAEVNTRAKGTGEVQDALTHYMDDMKAYDVLTAEQEISLAERIAELELAHYKALFAHAPALEVIASVLRAHMRIPKEFEALRKVARASGERARARWERSAMAAARAVREEDAARVVLPEVDAAVRKAFEGQPGTKRYLERVARARRAQQEAKNSFMTANLRLVVALARRYNHGLMPLADLIQEGNFGLMRAVERFDPAKGFRFSTYASWWIRHALNRALSDKARLVRLPVHLLDQAQRVAKATAELTSTSGEAPTRSELANKLGVSEDKLAFIEVHAHGRQPSSLDKTFGDDSDSTLLDIIPTPDEMGPEETLDVSRWPSDLEKLLKTLTPIEAQVLRYRFGLDDTDELTLREIGNKYNLSRERIRQLQEQALHKLREQLEGGASRKHDAA